MPLALYNVYGLLLALPKPLFTGVQLSLESSLDGGSMRLQAIGVSHSVFSLCVCVVVLLSWRIAGWLWSFLNINGIFKMAKVYSDVSGLSYELSQ